MKSSYRLCPAYFSEIRQTMKLFTVFFLGLSAVLMTACTSHPARLAPTEVDQEAKEASPPLTGEQPEPGETPPFNVLKQNKTLKLVRIMDGGACKNSLEGARGEFLIYADPQDIERIKKEKPAEIFQELESKIEDFSSHALQQAIEATNLSQDPFSLGEDADQDKLARQLIKNFQAAAQPAIDDFQRDTTLTIDVIPFSPSLVFYQKGCELTHINSDS